MKNVCEHYRITFDSHGDNTFFVHKPDGSTRDFRMSPSGLYYHDILGSANYSSRHQTLVQAGLDSDMVTTVKAKMARYSAKDIARAKGVRALQQSIGRPHLADFLSILDNKLIQNCPYTRADALAAEDIFGPDLGILKGKTPRRASPQVEVTLHPVPQDILQRYKCVTLGMDVMRVNGLPFLVTISEHIKFGTAEFLADQSKVTLVTALQHVITVYSARGFRPMIVLADGQFAPLEHDVRLLKLTPNFTSRDEHVGIIERFIRTLKDRSRGDMTTTPFELMPKAMVIELVYRCVFWLNLFPPKDGLSKTLSPRGLVTGFVVTYKRHCQLPFGTYVQTHEQHDNSMQPRTAGAIALRPSGNAQGGHRFLCLSTGRVVTRQHWTVLPMPDLVIAQVHRLARRAKMPAGLTFVDRYDGIDTDDADDSTYSPSDNDMDSVASAPDDSGDLASTTEWTPVPGRAGVDHDRSRPATVDEQQNHDQAQSTYQNYFDVLSGNDDDDDDDDDDSLPPLIDQVGYESDDDDNAEGDIESLDHRSDTNPSADNRSDTNNEPAVPADNRSDMNSEPAVPIDPDTDPRTMQQLRKLSHRDGTIAPVIEGRTRSQSHRHTMVQAANDNEPSLEDVLEQVHALVDALPVPKQPSTSRHPSVNLVTAQFPMKKGLKIFGDKGTEAVLAEMKQLHDRRVPIPKLPSELTPEQMKWVLEYLMFLKEKRSGKIKGRGCADGRKQRNLYSREESTSPTVSLESVFLTSVIDAKEGRDIATADIPGAFMQADQDDVVHVRFRGKMAELLSSCDPAMYQKFLVKEKGETVMYAELSKALYGTLRAALLFWILLTTTLMEWGFEVNPYDWCVANKDIDGKQCTIIWHVDDLKISHVSYSVVTKILDKLSEKFGKLAPLTITRGKVHEYLGMKLDFSDSGKVKIDMKQYIQDMLDELPDSFKGIAVTPAANHLFAIDEHAQKLAKEDADAFHTFTAKLLFLCKRARPDTQTATSFLCTRVSGPDVDDLKKLRRVMQYLRGTLGLVLTLEAFDLHILKWSIDGSFAVHHDMKGHTGGSLSLGRGTISGVSTKQKLNTRSSTETEVVAVDDCMPQVLWTRYFMEAQGYKVKDNIVYQDNMSAMLLEKNGRASSSKRTRHINIRYFFITDRIKAKEIRVEYCPSKDLIADFFTKPLQGQLFYKLRAFILNLPEDDPAPAPDLDHRSVLEEQDSS